MTPRAPGVPAVEIAGVTAGWVEGRPVVTDLDLVVPATGVTRLVAPNGAGKSTLVELIAGYLRPWSGRVRVAGRSAHDPAARDVRRVARTQPRLFDQMTVGDHLAFFARVRGEDRGALLARATALGLAPWFDQNAGALSSGTAKKLWFVLCSAGPAALLVLDEPFNAVDDEGTALLCAEVDRQAVDRAVLVISHHVPPALRVDRVLTLPRPGEPGPA